MARERKTVDELLRSPVAQRAFEEEILLGRVRGAITALLEKHGMKQSELAEKLGVSRGRVSQCLSGAENMTLKTLAGIGHALGFRFDVIAEPITPGDHLARESGAEQALQFGELRSELSSLDLAHHQEADDDFPGRVTVTPQGHR